MSSDLLIRSGFNRIEATPSQEGVVRGPHFCRNRLGFQRTGCLSEQLDHPFHTPIGQRLPLLHPLLKLIVQHSPQLLAFLCGLHLRLSKPQWQHVLRLADALVVSEARHKTLAGLSRLIVEAPDASNGADTLRISPWTAEDLRAPIRHFIVADLVAYAHQSGNWTLYVSLDDSLDAKDKGTRHLEAVDSHHDHTKSQGKKPPASTNGAVHVEVRLALGARSSAYDGRLSLREKTVRRLKKQRV